MMPSKNAKTTDAIIVKIIAVEQCMALPIGSISPATLLRQQKY